MAGHNLAQKLRKPDGERKGEMSHKCWLYRPAPTDDKLPLLLAETCNYNYTCPLLKIAVGVESISTIAECHLHLRE